MQDSEVLQLIETANSELSPDRSNALYRLAIENCDAVIKTRKDDFGFVLKSQSLRELALQSKSLKSRTCLWKQCLDTLSIRLTKGLSPVLAEHLAICTAAMFQDQFCDLTFTEQRKRLSEAMTYVNDCLKEHPTPTISASLLARRSSLLRFRTQIEMTHRQKYSTLQEAHRCAIKAIDTYEHTGAKFELALSKWALARFETTDEGYTLFLKAAEGLFLSEEMNRIEVARLTIPRFYRMTYRPLEACESFETLENEVKHIRRFLGLVDIYAESVIHLWFQNFPDLTVMKHANNALSLCERAIDAGFADARKVLNLAYLRAIHDGEEAGRIALRGISLSNSSSFWNDVVRLSDMKLLNDVATQSFLMGITDSNVITKLGTFILTFTEDSILAGRLYNLAVRINPKNPIALTNWARYCLHYDPGIPREDLERLLQKASTYSDRRFQWWRVVLNELHSHRNQDKEPARPLERIGETRTNPTDLKEIRKRFKLVSRLVDVQKRGYELEKLVFHLARLSFSIATPSYRFRRGANSKTQVDCYFEHHSDRYRVECKWTNAPLEPPEFIYFMNSLDVAGISGLFISMSGFTPSTKEHAQEHRKERPVLLVDGEEITMVFDGTINFDELIAIKRQHYDQCSETYFKVTKMTASAG